MIDVRATALPDGTQVVYTPFESGRYDVGPGLLRLGQHAVHGRVESHVFAFDDRYAAYLRAKLESRARGLHLYYQQAALRPGLRRAALSAWLDRLAPDSAGAVTWDGTRLVNRWLGWALTLDLRRGTVEDIGRFPAPLSELVEGLDPLDALDALALNVQEDLAIAARDPSTGTDWQAALHVCFPQHWDPREKVGRPFAEVHAPVAGASGLVTGASRLVAAMVEKGPFLRFAWGTATSARLDHHPAAPPDGDRQVGAFRPEATYVRVERQTLLGLATEGGALFTIRPYVYPLVEAVRDPNHRLALARALRGMTDDQLAYKGLVTLRDPIVAWLESGVERS